MRFLVSCSLMALILTTIIIGVSQPIDKPVIINLMIDAQLPQFATLEQANEAENNLEAITNAINSRGLVSTVFSTEDMAKSEISLDLTRIGYEFNFELGMSGNHSNEDIAALSYADQKSILESSKKFVESNRVCGKNEIVSNGFMPQSFKQNQDTYRVLDALGIKYDTGFQAGLLYDTGHENDVWPYLVNDHRFYAVPVSTYKISDKKVILQDRYFEENDLDSNQWYDAIAGKLDEIQSKDEPLVLSLTTSLSGNGKYLDALNRFMDYALSKNAKFVTTMQLVTLTESEGHNVTSLAADASEECPTCGQNMFNITTSITRVQPESECETCNRSANNSSTEQN